MCFCRANVHDSNSERPWHESDSQKNQSCLMNKLLSTINCIYFGHPYESQPRTPTGVPSWKETLKGTEKGLHDLRGLKRYSNCTPWKNTGNWKGTPQVCWGAEKGLQKAWQCMQALNIGFRGAQKGLPAQYRSVCIPWFSGKNSKPEYFDFGGSR